MQILLVEDEIRLARILADGLRSENFSVDLASDGEEAIAKLTSSYDLVILDRMLPKKSGLEVLRFIREEKWNLPVIILSAQWETEDRITGLSEGADDYLAKPFSFDELLARIHALLRRSTGKNSLLTLGSLTLDTRTKKVERKNLPLTLSSTEYRLLEYLMYHQGEILSETELLEHVWDHNYDGLSNVVSVYIGYLRQKIDRAYSEETPLLKTVRGMGYTLTL